MEAEMYCSWRVHNETHSGGGEIKASELQSQIEVSLQQLEPFKDQPEFEKQNKI